MNNSLVYKWPNKVALAILFLTVFSCACQPKEKRLNGSTTKFELEKEVINFTPNALALQADLKNICTVPIHSDAISANARNTLDDKYCPTLICLFNLTVSDS